MPKFDDFVHYCECAVMESEDDECMGAACRDLMQFFGVGILVGMERDLCNFTVEMVYECVRQGVAPGIIPMDKGQSVIPFVAGEPGECEALGLVGNGGAEDESVIGDVGDEGGSRTGSNEGNVAGDGDGFGDGDDVFAATGPHEGVDTLIFYQTDGVFDCSFFQGVTKVGFYRPAEDAAGSVDVLDGQEGRAGGGPVSGLKINAAKEMIHQPNVDKSEPEGFAGWLGRGCQRGWGRGRIGGNRFWGVGRDRCWGVGRSRRRRTCNAGCEQRYGKQRGSQSRTASTRDDPQRRIEQIRHRSLL